MKICRFLILVICCFFLSGCNTNTESDVPNVSIEEDISPSDKADASISSGGNQVEESKCNVEYTPLDEAVISAVFEENSGKYLPGECQGVGYKIFEIFSDGEAISVYALIEYIEYGFQDNSFVNVSGTRAKVLLEFKVENDQTYDLMGYTPLDSTSGLPEEELEELMAPLIKTGKDYTYAETVFQELRTQADSYAKDYLQSIGRNAVVYERNAHENNSLLALGVDENIYFMLTKNESTNTYPDWNGTCEKIENGVRYVYQTYYDDVSKTIQYTKTQYETNKIVEQMAFDSATGIVIE